LVSLANTTYNAFNCNDNGVKWLSRTLPEPYRGNDEDGNIRYIKAIDDGKGKEVAAAIRSLI